MRANGIRGQRCLDLFFLELKKHREKLLKDKSTTTQAYLQRTITTFFAPSFLVMLQVNQGPQEWALDQAITKGLQ